MSVALKPAADARTTRLSLLVSAGEAEEIVKAAEACGLSVSSFLRERALGGGRDEAAALRQVDALIDGMTRELDEAVAQLNGVMARLNA